VIIFRDAERHPLKIGVRPKARRNMTIVDREKREVSGERERGPPEWKNRPAIGFSFLEVDRHGCGTRQDFPKSTRGEEKVTQGSRI